MAYSRAFDAQLTGYWGLEMDSQFQNQLNNREIKQGLAAYLSKSIWPFALLIMIAVFVFSYMQSNRVADAVVFSAIAVILAMGLLFWALRRQLSPSKVATYRRCESRLEIINSDGAKHSYNCNEIRSIAAKEVIVLRFSKGSFAIVAKRNIPQEQIGFFSNLPSAAAPR